MPIEVAYLFWAFICAAFWSWGGSSRGTIVVNGQLMTDPYYVWKSLNYTSGWLGKVYIDPTTGNPVYGLSIHIPACKSTIILIQRLESQSIPMRIHMDSQIMGMVLPTIHQTT